MTRVILIVLLILSLGFALYTYWPQISSYLPKPEKGKSPEISKAVTSTTIAISSFLPTSELQAFPGQPSEEVKKIELSDPFSLRVNVKRKVLESKPPEKPEERLKPAEPVLEGIWIDSGMRVAFISGQALGVGSKIMGWKVTSITRDQVVLERGSQVKILRMEGK